MMKKDTGERNELQTGLSEAQYEKDGYVYVPFFTWSKPISIDEIRTRKFSLLKSE